MSNHTGWWERTGTIRGKCTQQGLNNCCSPWLSPKPWYREERAASYCYLFGPLLGQKSISRWLIPRDRKTAGEISIKIFSTNQSPWRATGQGSDSKIAEASVPPWRLRDRRQESGPQPIGSHTKVRRDGMQ